MNLRVVASVLGLVLMVTAGILTVPLMVGLAHFDGAGEVGRREPWAFLAAMVISVAAGRWLHRRFRTEAPVLGVREAFAIVSASWLATAVAGSLPFLLSGQCPSPSDAFFETMSGLTTTGASVIADVEAMPRGLLFWRSFTHWIGGMGIIVLSLAILPALGVGGFRLFKAEMSGVLRERFQPRIADTARILWQVYVLLTVAQILLLLAGGMPLFDAACTTFGTVATGGFAVRNAGLGAYGSAYVEYITCAFMFLCGMNFSLHYAIIHGRLRHVLRDRELRVYAGILVVCTLLLVAILWSPGKSLEETARAAVFQAVSIMTTTGFSTQDFDLWPQAGRCLLVLLMFVGGCAGSTAGSMKVIRHVLMAKLAFRELRQLVTPHAVIHVKINEKAVDEDVLRNVGVFFAFFLGSFAAGTLVMAMLGLELETAATAVLACLANIGPGLGKVGPMTTFADVPALGKWVLSFLMLVGRLEVFGVLLLFHPLLWKR